MLPKKMSDEEAPPKSKITSALLIGFLVVLLGWLFMVPFASMWMGLKKRGLAGKQTVQDEISQASSPKKADTHQYDLSALRTVVEKAASNALVLTNMTEDKNSFQIQVQPPATIESASSKVQDVLTKNHINFVEAYDRDLIRIIVVLKSSQWPELSGMLSQATDLYGFQYRGPKETGTTTNGSDTTVAKIEIVRRPSQ